MKPEYDLVYLSLRKGPNDLELAVLELGGGCGFICRLSPLEPGVAVGFEPAAMGSGR